MPRHQLVVDRLRDFHAHCSCGHWTFWAQTRHDHDLVDVRDDCRRQHAQHAFLADLARHWETITT